MAPHKEPEQADGEDREDHRAITKHRLTRKRRKDVRRRSHARQDRDVDFRMSEEPEQVLPQYRGTAGVQREVRIGAGKNTADVKSARDEEARSGYAIEQQQNARAEQHRERKQRQHRGRKPRPASERHAHQRHAFRAHVQKCRNEIERAEQRTDAEDRDADRPEVHAGALARARDPSKRAEWSISGPTADWSNRTAAASE